MKCKHEYEVIACHTIKKNNKQIIESLLYCNKCKKEKIKKEIKNEFNTNQIPL